MPDLTFHPGLTNEAYHQLSAVSPSRLKLLARSPLHYFDQWEAPDREVQAPTDAMARGTALHTAVLEPELWDQTVAIRPALDCRTKAGKEAAEAFEATAAGRLVLSQDDADDVRRMADAVCEHPAARHILGLPGRREASYTWTDAATGIECKTRPDWHADDRSFVVDLKTTKDASRREFAKSISNFDYHVQAAWNRSALDAEQFLTIAVESVRPFAVAVYPASAAMLTAGERRIQQALELLADCRRTGIWPGYGDLVLDPIDLPAWNHD